MSLNTRLGDLITAVGTDYKQLRTWISGSSSGSLTGLATSDKTSIVAAINEVQSEISGAGGPPADATETVKGIAEIATQAETDAGVDDARFVTPLKLSSRLSTVTIGDATETVKGKIELATQSETTTGTDDARAVTPLKLSQKLAAWAQPLSANLTSLAGVASGVFGRTLLTSADAAAAKASLGLAAVASSGSASDITTGTLPTSVMPPLAINDTFPVASQAAMLALTAQRGDVAIRSDINRSFILASDSPTTLADWKQLTAGGDVTSVASKTGAVTLVKADVGLSNVDNTSDANKPVSTAQATADALNLKIAQNLNDLADKATARTNLSVYSRAELGDPETDLVALYTIAKA